MPDLPHRVDTDAIPPMLICDQPGTFAYDVLARRHPALIEQTRHAHPYGPELHQALDALAAEIEHTVTYLPADDPGSGEWDNWIGDYHGKSWYDLPFLVAESYFYRKLLVALGHFRAGPWQRHDPFAHLKGTELDRLRTSRPGTGTDQPDNAPTLDDLLLASLWGNRADLGFAIGRPTQTSPSPADDGALVADDRPLLRDLLTRGIDQLILIADNAGHELTADLLLLDHLLTNQLARHCVLHVKPEPYYVSDATTADVAQTVQTLADTTPTTRAAAQRLKDAARTGRLVIQTHWFHTAPFEYHRMPDDLARQYATADLAIAKGDLNYRRLVGDRAWPTTTPFSSATTYFPCPVAALRTLKSDVLLGIDPPTATKLDATAAARTDGTHALVQLRT